MDTGPNMSSFTAVALRYSSFTTSKHRPGSYQRGCFSEITQPLFPSFQLETLENSGRSSLPRQVGGETEGILTFKAASCLKEVGWVDSHFVSLIVFIFSWLLIIFLLISALTPTPHPSASSEDGLMTWSTQEKGREQAKSGSQTFLQCDWRHPCPSSPLLCPSTPPAWVKVVHGWSSCSLTRVLSPRIQDWEGSSCHHDGKEWDAWLCLVNVQLPLWVWWQQAFSIDVIKNNRILLLHLLHLLAFPFLLHS